MDDLDLLKQDWKKQESSLPHLSYNDIYKMIWKRSSSIVKWIFVISIIEFLFWAVINLFLADNEYWNEMERLHLYNFTIISYIVSYAITFYFIYRFYRNYKSISSTDNSKTLMKSILKTRSTVKYYIGYILISTAITTLVYTYFIIVDHANSSETLEASKYNFDAQQWLIFVGLSVLFIAAFLGVIWLFYRLIYGILLRRLSKNYKELKRLELENSK